MPDPANPTLPQRLWWLPILLLTLFLALPRIFGEHWPSDAPYYQAIATQMAREGHWWSPMQGDLHYFNKPPLAFWAHGALVTAFGDADWAARVPEAACYVLTCLLVGWLGRRLHGPATGLLAGCVLALTSEWVRCVGNFRLEFPHTLLHLAAVACWVKAFVPPAKTEPSQACRPIRWSILAGLCIGLALMSKPIIALALPAFGLLWLAAAGLLTRRSLALLALSGAVALLIALPWHISMIAQHGEAFTRAYFVEQSLQRATGELFHNRPWHWYFQLIAGTVPESINPRLMWPLYAGALAGLLVVAMRCRSSPTRPGDTLAALWTLVWFIALSAFSGKQNYYLLVVHPGAAWLFAIAAAAAVQRLAGHGIHAAALRKFAAALIAIALAAHTVRLFATIPRPAPRLPAEQESLIAFLRKHRDAPVYNAGLAYPEAALIYLKTGIWPRSLEEKKPVAPADIPPGALMVYRESHPATASADPADLEVFAAPVGGSVYTVRKRHAPQP